jgi:16S rRNA processing protein RimM
MEGSSDLVVLGVVTGAHGIGGEIRVRPFNPESNNLAHAHVLRLRDKAGLVRALRVHRSRHHKGLFLLKLEGITDRSSAEAARGQEVVLSRAELAALDEDEYYYLDLIGMEVVAQDGASLGDVTELFETGSNVVLVVRRPKSARERLIPFIEDAVIRVEKAERRIVVRPELGTIAG